MSSEDTKTTTLEETVSPEKRQYLYNPQRIRIFIEVRSLNKQYSLMLDKSRYPTLDHFLNDLCNRLCIPYIARLMVLYLPPNHQLLDLEPIEKDDLLTLATRQEIMKFNQEFDVVGQQIGIIQRGRVRDEFEDVVMKDE